MMLIVTFFIKSVISSGILFVYYWLALRNKHLHQYNRFYLLSALVIPVVIPFLNFKLYVFEQYSPTGLNNLSDEIILNSAIQQYSSFIWERVLYGVIISINMLMLCTLFFKIAWIYKIKKHYPITRMKGFNLIETELKQAPFCFLNNLFWRKSISMHDDNGKKIFAHELTHIEQRHTYDKLFSQIMLCFLWINPFYWFIQQELNVVHEFIADSKSIKDGDSESFAKMLLLSYNEGRYLNPSHSFFNSSIQRRLIMITTSKNTQYIYWRITLVLPITLLLCMLFSFTITKVKTESGIDADAGKIHKMVVNNSTNKNRNDTTIIANVKFTKKDGTIGSLNTPVSYAVGMSNTEPTKIISIATKIKVTVKFANKDGTTGSKIIPVKYSIKTAGK